ncbi:FecR domain-containing protein [Burkholderiaceae bacterium UC74_6]
MKAPGTPLQDETDIVVTPEVAAEAAVWIAKLHGPDRSSRMERDFLTWQARSAAHRKAFERATDIWEMVPRIRVQDAFASVSTHGAAVAADADGGGYGWQGGRRRWALLMVLPAAALATLVAVFIRGVGEDYATQVGEQRQVVLEDGSRMTLNTNTQVQVRMGKAERSIEIEHGEALFEVTKDARRPFVVHAGGTEVQAIGTVFSVRVAESGDHRVDAVAVALVEGRVAVRPDSWAQQKKTSASSPILMNAGERLNLARADAPATAPTPERLDKPSMDRLLAWKRSEVDFDDVPLSEAIAEMNRYSRTPITLLGGDALAGLRVSGQFRTGDNLGFANAVSTLHRLQLKERAGRLELSLPP